MDLNLSNNRRTSNNNVYDVLINCLYSLGTHVTDEVTRLLSIRLLMFRLETSTDASYNYVEKSI